MSFAREVVDAAEPSRLALVAIGRDGERREITFGEVADRSARMAGALAARGVRAGDVVVTVAGNRPEWAYAMLACWRIGAVAQPCSEQLRPADLRARMEAVEPAAVVADARDLDLVAASGFDGPVLAVPDEAVFDHEPVAARDFADDHPALIVFTSGTAGEPKPIRHGHGYLRGQSVQAEHWYGAEPGDLCWCTAASGWSLSARNAFVAAWIRGAAALLHDARFDPEERMELLERERVSVLCMSPTEYRAIAKRCTLRPPTGLRHACAAGEPLNPEVVRAFQEDARVSVHDGYGQTETGHLTGMPIGPPVRPGSMGRPLPGFHAWIDEGELVVDPATVPTFFIDGPRDRPWRTGDRVSEDEEGYLWFEGRTDDVIISAGYRIGPFEVESALVSHPAVAEAAAVAAPDDVRGQVVRAVVVLRDGHSPSPALATELQEHVKAETAPYKYPRIVDFASELPKTPSGKIKRAELRRQPSGSSDAR
ncbi:MAG TPA: AMP-binding protein [Thermoleophilaceae bacterium]|jgi:acetyl-CoA synthetase|nr:AMP-binding protein [Thermoleophilaceae bacterium]